jgi:hypothetical protein
MDFGVHKHDVRCQADTFQGSGSATRCREGGFQSRNAQTLQFPFWKLPLARRQPVRNAG